MNVLDIHKDTPPNANGKLCPDCGENLIGGLRYSLLKYEGGTNVLPSYERLLGCDFCDYEEISHEVHSLIIRNFKTSLGFDARCSCGKKIRRVSGCNSGGRQYGLCGTVDDFLNHIGEESPPEGSNYTRWLDKHAIIEGD